MPVEGKCGFCGKTFIARKASYHQRFCSRTCASRQQYCKSPDDLQKCKGCGVILADVPHQNRLCLKCMKKRKLELARKRPPKQCKQCGKDFWPISHTSKYCSKRCVDDSKRGVEKCRPGCELNRAVKGDWEKNRPMYLEKTPEQNYLNIPFNFAARPVVQPWDKLGIKHLIGMGG